jgi:uncharacterized protein YbjT (DUF2867 family)
MRIAVAGGTGVVGRYVVEAARAAGHDVVVMSRGRGVDLVTGQGVDRALDGVDVVVDVTNVTDLRRKVATAFFESTTRTLLAAEERAGVRHHVLLSIVGIDRVEGYGYFTGKLAQERLVCEGRVPWTILRATQFHEFPEQLLARLPGPFGVVPRMRSQPVAAREVGEHLVRLAEGPALGMAPELAGPREEQLVDMARRLVRARRARRWVVPVSFPKAGPAMRGGALLPDADGPRGRITFDEWLRAAPGPVPPR